MFIEVAWSKVTSNELTVMLSYKIITKQGENSVQ